MKLVVASAVLLFASASWAEEQELPVYPGAVHTRIGNDLVIGGEYYRLGYFKTHDSPNTVADYFVKYWEKLGIPTTVVHDGTESITVSAFYTREGLMRSVVVMLHDGQTVGFSVLKDLWVRPPSKNNPALFSLEGSLFTSDTSARDETGGTNARTQLVQGKMIAVRDEVMKKLEAQGFQLDREQAFTSDGQPHRVLEFLRGHDQASVAITEVDEDEVTVLETLVTSSRPDGLPTETVDRPAPKKTGAKK